MVRNNRRPNSTTDALFTGMSDIGIRTDARFGDEVTEDKMTCSLILIELQPPPKGIQPRPHWPRDLSYGTRSKVETTIGVSFVPFKKVKVISSARRTSAS